MFEASRYCSTGPFSALIFIVIFPALLLWGCLQIASSHFVDSHEQEVLDEARQTLFQLRRGADDERFIARRLNYMFGMLNEEKVDKASMQKHLDRFKSEGFGFVDLRFFDENIEHVGLEGESDKFRAFIKKIFSALTQPETKGKSDLLENGKSFFKSFLGNVDPAELASGKSELIRARPGGEPGFFYWNTIYSHLEDYKFKGGLLAFFQQKSIPDNFALRSLLHEVNQNSRPSVKFAAIDLSKKSISIIPDSFEANCDSGILRENLIQMRSELISERKIDDFFLLSLQLTATMDLVAFAIPGKEFSYRQLFFILKLLLLPLFLIVLRFVIIYYNQNSLPGFIVRFEKIFILVYLVALPALAFSIAAFLHVFDRQELDLQNLRRELSLYSQNVEESYNSRLKSLENSFRKLVFEVDKSEAEKSQLPELCVKHELGGIVRQAFIVDKHGKILESWPKQNSVSGLFEKIIPVVAKKQFSSQKSTIGGLKSALDGMVYERLKQGFSEFSGNDSTEADIFSAFERKGQLNEFSFAGKRHFLFMDFSKDESYLVVLWSDSSLFARQFLEKLVAQSKDKYVSKPGKVRFALMPKKQNHVPIPREFNKYPIATSLAEKVTRSNSDHFSIAGLDGLNWLVVASPVQNVPDYVFFSMKSIENIESRAFYGLLLIMAFLFAFFLISVFTCKNLL